MVLLSTASVLNLGALKGARFGSSYLTQVELAERHFDFFGISYEQPSTVTTNRIFVEGGYIYLARSDGSILRGSRPIWDLVHAYEDSSSLLRLDISTQDTSPASESRWKYAERTTNGVKLKGVTVKI
jgi:hypothetical protein